MRAFNKNFDSSALGQYKDARVFARASSFQREQLSCLIKLRFAGPAVHRFRHEREAEFCSA